METITTEKGTEPLTNRPAQSYQGNESEKGKQLDPRQCPKDRQAGQAGPQTSSASHSTEEKTHTDQGSRPTEHQLLPQPGSVHPEDSARPSNADFLQCLCLPFEPSSWIHSNNLSHLFLRVGTASLHLEIFFFFTPR